MGIEEYGKKKSILKVSVIMPVFNAAPFVEKAALSVIDQPETAELILIEDGSSDDSYEICQKLESQFDKIRLITFKNRENKGAGAARNLGLEIAQYPFISFLDADDFYLPDRFKNANQVFHQNKDAAGCYDSIGIHQYNTDGISEILKINRGKQVTGLKKRTAPEDLFNTLVILKQGHIHLDGLVIKRSIVDDGLRFDTDLRQVQDRDFILRLAKNYRLYPGSLDEIIAKRGVHQSNRILNLNRAYYYRAMFHLKWIRHSFYGISTFNLKLIFIIRYLKFLLLQKLPIKSHKFALLVALILLPLFIVRFAPKLFTLK